MYSIYVIYINIYIYTYIYSHLDSYGIPTVYGYIINNMSNFVLCGYISKHYLQYLADPVFQILRN